MTNNLKLNIADIVFLLIAKEKAYTFRDCFPYSLFLAKGRPEVILRFQYDSDYHRDKNLLGKVLFDTQPNWRLCYSNKRYFLEARDRAMVLSPDFTFGEVHVTRDRNYFPFTYPLDEVLMINLLGRKRGILVHACGVKKNNGGGLLFAGASGAGKSTITHFWKKGKDTTILSDDRIIIRNMDSKFWIYGTPWHGDAKACSTERASLKKLFFLKHAKNNSIRKIEPLDAASRLIVCSFPAFWDKQGMKFTLKFCAKLAQDIPCYELGFVPDKSILDFLGDVV